ncbi:hypothetical protein LH51_14905 [Nitrincola sp. A-D6]|uniref:hypothetical protein n=1 Tax=Nitrincola sp. A-D6 TaxID=1545442 RepID=UPI00051FCE0B|nr:hypothetical protein [Nitrincola sp. A-D6]KGK41430.1 hypothetical protein LH51_14905 [Nitrincola sp. A-D6]
MGELTVWADPTPLLALLQRQQLIILMTATATLVLMLFGVWLALRPPNTTTADDTAQAPAPDEQRFDDVMQTIQEADEAQTVCLFLTRMKSMIWSCLQS